MYSSDEEDEAVSRAKVADRRTDAGGNPWVIGGTSDLLEQRVPPPRARFRKAAVADTALPGSKVPPGVIPKVRRDAGVLVAAAQGKVRAPRGCMPCASVVSCQRCRCEELGRGCTGHWTASTHRFAHPRRPH
jgi:hypothetical protein